MQEQRAFTFFPTFLNIDLYSSPAFREEQGGYKATKEDVSGIRIVSSTDTDQESLGEWKVKDPVGRDKTVAKISILS